MGKKKITRRDFLRTAAIGTIGVAAAACAPAPTPTPIVVEKVVEKLVTPTPKPTPKERAYIIFLTQETDPKEVAWYRKHILLFEEQNPDIRIELQLTGPDQIIEKMVAAVTAGVRSLDMFQPNPAMGFLLAAKGLLLPIDDVVAEVGGDDFFYGGNVMKWEGKRYGVPFGGGVGMMWYRKDFFEADGIKVPTTWEELEEVARHFTRKFNPKSPTEFGITLPLALHQSNSLFAEPFLWANGGEFFDKDLNLVFDSAENAEAIEWFVGMAQYTPPEATGYGWGDMIDTFLTEKTAMTFYLGRVLGRVYTSAPHLLGKVGVFQYPKRKLQVSYDDPNYYVINAKTPYPEQCKRWLKYCLLGEPANEFLCSIPSHLPPATKDQEKWWNQDVTGCKELDENPDIKKAFGEAQKVAYNPILNSGGIIEAVKRGMQTYYPTRVPNPFMVAADVSPNLFLAKAVQNVLLQGMKPRDAIKAVMPDLEQAVKRMMEEIGWKR
ncbi:MAG: ABC transporter substrate-binding protein [Anaerolineae bacterium]